MEIVIISLIAFLTSILKYFSGFEAWAILTFVSAILFPVDIAIELSAGII